VCPLTATAVGCQTGGVAAAGRRDCGSTTRATAICGDTSTLRTCCPSLLRRRAEEMSAA